MPTLRDYISAQSMVIAPGAYDGLSARLVEQAGFSAVYASGGAIARSMGLPDIGLLSLTEVAERLRQMTAVTTIPVIADADTGFGNINNVKRTVSLFEQAGVSAFHLEDQTFPKRCGHLDNKTLIPVEEMVQKCKAALEARSDDDTLIIARTDAIAVEGFESAINRALAYEQAGADMIFVEAPTSVEQIQTIAQSIQAPLLINMFAGGKTPLLGTAELAEMGYRVVIIPSDTQRAAIYGMQKVLASIQAGGDSSPFKENMVSFNEREEIVGTKEYLS